MDTEYVLSGMLEHGELSGLEYSLYRGPCYNMVRHRVDNNLELRSSELALSAEAYLTALPIHERHGLCLHSRELIEEQARRLPDIAEYRVIRAQTPSRWASLGLIFDAETPLLQLPADNAESMLIPWLDEHLASLRQRFQRDLLWLREALDWRLFEKVGKKREVQLFLAGQALEVCHAKSPFKFVLTPEKGPWLLRNTQVPPLSTPFRLEVYTKTDVFVGHLCVVAHKTPALDQLLAVLLHVEAGAEQVLLEKANWLRQSRSADVLQLLREQCPSAQPVVSRGFPAIMEGAFCLQEITAPENVCCTPGVQSLIVAWCQTDTMVSFS